MSAACPSAQPLIAAIPAGRSWVHATAARGSDAHATQGLGQSARKGARPGDRVASIATTNGVARVGAKGLWAPRSPGSSRARSTRLLACLRPHLPRPAHARACGEALCVRGRGRQICPRPSGASRIGAGSRTCVRPALASSSGGRRHWQCGVCGTVRYRSALVRIANARAGTPRVRTLRREQLAVARQLPRHTESDAGSAPWHASPARRGHRSGAELVCQHGMGEGRTSTKIRAEKDARSPFAGRCSPRWGSLRDGTDMVEAQACRCRTHRDVHVRALPAIWHPWERAQEASATGHHLRGICAHLARPSHRRASASSTLTVRVTWAPCRHRPLACRLAALLGCVESGGTIATRVFAHSGARNV